VSGVWPLLDAADLELRVRTYLNEVAADFYTQAEIWRWLSIAAKDIAQKTLCVRRILDVKTTSAARNVATRCYKVLHVEYVPSSGRAQMLTKIDPLRAGHYPTNGTAPQYWYEFGSYIGIDPVPDAVYYLRLYVADLPKMQTVYNGIAFVEGGAANQWTDSGTGWACSTTATHSGTGPDTLTANTALAAANTDVTMVFTVDSIGATGTLSVSCGAGSQVIIPVAGVHMHSRLATTPWQPALIATNDVVISGFYAYIEKDYTVVGDQTELPAAYQHLLALYATYSGLTKDRKYGPAQMLESIYNNELAYLRANIVEVIPDGRASLKYS